MTASKTELLDKLRSNRDEVVSRLRSIPPEKFEEGRYESGWNGRQILAHIAAIEWSYPRLIDVAREAQAPKPEAKEEKPAEPAHRPARGGINDYNERQVEKRAQMSVEELIAEFEQNRATTIAAFEEADESLLGQPIKSAGGITGPLADVVSMVAIMHVDQHARDIAGGVGGNKEQRTKNKEHGTRNTAYGTRKQERQEGQGTSDMSDGTGTSAATAMQERLKGLFADTLGMRFVEVTAERVRAELEVREELCTVPGIMHGGAIMAFADTLGGVATSLNLPPGAGTTTIESKTNFLAAARTGQTISGECVPLHRGKQTLVWQTRVTVEGRAVALVTQTQIVLAAKQTPQEVLAALFAEKPVEEQKALLATLERAGAGLYRAWAANEMDAATNEALLAAAEREEENARTLEG